MVSPREVGENQRITNAQRAEGFPDLQREKNRFICADLYSLDRKLHAARRQQQAAWTYFSRPNTDPPREEDAPAARKTVQPRPFIPHATTVHLSAPHRRDHDVEVVRRALRRSREPVPGLLPQLLQRPRVLRHQRPVHLLPPPERRRGLGRR